MVNTFYDLATDFYEYGWGESFHFSRIEKGDTFKEATMKHELYLAMKLALRPDEKVLVCTFHQSNYKVHEQLSLLFRILMVA